MENSDFENSDARKNQRFASSIDLYELQAFGRDQSGRDQASSYGELSNRIIWNIRKSVFQCKEQNRQKFIENVSETKKLLIENLIKKMKPAVMGDKLGWVWMSRKMIEKRFFFKSSEYQDSDATNKINRFPPQYSFKNVMF